MSIAEGPPIQHLTAREAELLALLMHGLSTNAELCDAMTVTDTTVHYHLANLRLKFGVADRTRLVSLAWQLGTVVDNHWTPR